MHRTSQFTIKGWLRWFFFTRNSTNIFKTSNSFMDKNFYIRDIKRVTYHLGLFPKLKKKKNYRPIFPFRIVKYFHFLNFLFCIGVWLINNVIVSGEQQRDSTIHLHVSSSCSVAQSCPTPCDPIDYSMPGLFVPHHLPKLPKFMSTALVMPSSHLILWHPLLFLPSIFPSIRNFPNESTVGIRWPKSWSFSFSISPANEYSRLISIKIDWFYPLLSKGLSGVLSSTTVQRHLFLGTPPSLQSSSHSVCDQWENDSFDFTDLCQHSNASAFQHNV